MSGQVILNNKRLFTLVTFEIVCKAPIDVVHFSMSSPAFLKDFSHSSHWIGFSPVCIILWTSRWCFLLKDLLHSRQANGRSPVCIIWCILKWVAVLNCFSHNLQGKDLSDECQSKCGSNRLDDLKDFWHRGQLTVSCFSWTILCALTYSGSLKHFLHWSHWYGLSFRWNFMIPQRLVVCKWFSTFLANNWFLGWVNIFVFF